MTTVATFNVYGVNGRLPLLLKWLAEKQPDIACLQELKTSDEKFPIEAIRDAGYSAIWHGQNPTTASPSSAGSANPSSFAGASPAIRTICIAAT